MANQEPWGFLDDEASQLDLIWHDDLHTLHTVEPAPTPPRAPDGIIDPPLPSTAAEHSTAPSPLPWDPTSANTFGFDFGDPLRQGAASPAEAFQGLGDSFGNQDIALDHGGAEAQAPPGTRPRRANRGPSALSWATQKPNIRRLYIEEDHTLEETKRLMKENYSFDASTQMYKDKFQDWGFVKNIPHKVTGKLLRIVDERKPRDTEFRLGPRRWTAAEIRKKHGRGGKASNHATQVSPVLPNGLIWRTPTPSVSPTPDIALVRQFTNTNMFSVNPSLPFHPDSALLGDRWNSEVPSASGMPNRPWSPVVLASSMPPPRAVTPLDARRLSFTRLTAPASPFRPSSARPWSLPSLPPLIGTGRDPFLLRPLSTRPTWGGKTFSELQSMRRDALSLASAGRIDDAIRNLRNVVEGFQHLLAPTHDLTLTSGFELAELLGNNDGMEEANHILDWLGQSLIKKHGLYHIKTVSHYVKIADLLRTWSRDEDARLLMFRIVQFWNDDDDATESHLQLRIPGAASGLAMPTDLEVLDKGTLFNEPNNADDVEIQLQLARVLMSSQGHPFMDMEPILNTLFTYGEKNELLPQTINVRCCLATYFRAQCSEPRAIQTLDAARLALEDHLGHVEVPPQALLTAAKGLAFLFTECNEPEKCEDILELTTECLEMQPMAAGLQLRETVDLIKAVNFPISVGMEYHKRFSWAAAVPWFERALANSMKILGRYHRKTQMLEKTLEEGRFQLQSTSKFLPFDLENLL